MELSKKTTILFPPDMHARLVQLANQQGTSVGDLVRVACEKQYGIVSSEDRVEAVRALSALALPVADAATMKHESVAGAETLLP